MENSKENMVHLTKSQRYTSVVAMFVQNVAMFHILVNFLFCLEFQVFRMLCLYLTEACSGALPILFSCIYNKVYFVFFLKQSFRTAIQSLIQIVPDHDVNQ